MHRWFVGVRRVAADGPLEAGALRTVTLATGRGYRERITRFEPGRAFSYAVVDPPAGFRCWSADIDVEEEGAVTRVVWRIRYRIGAGNPQARTTTRDRICPATLTDSRGE